MAKTRTNRVSESNSTINETPRSNMFRVKEGSVPVRIRAGAGINTTHVDGRYLGSGIHEIDEVKEGPGSKTGWGHLASGIGWVGLDFVEKIK